MNKIRKDIALNTHERDTHFHVFFFGSLVLSFFRTRLGPRFYLAASISKSRRFSSKYGGFAKREELMTLSPSDLAKKLKEVGLPKTLKQCLEGKDCVEWYFALLLII